MGYKSYSSILFETIHGKHRNYIIRLWQKPAQRNLVTKTRPERYAKISPKNAKARFKTDNIIFYLSVLKTLIVLVIEPKFVIY